MCKTFQRKPSDDWFETLDPMERMYMYLSWLQDFEDNYEMLRSHGILIGSFTNPEAARKMVALDKPTFATSEEEFEQATQKVVEARNRILNDKKKRRRRRNK